MAVVATESATCTPIVWSCNIGSVIQEVCFHHSLRQCLQKYALLLPNVIGLTSKAIRMSPQQKSSAQMGDIHRTRVMIVHHAIVRVCCHSPPVVGADWEAWVNAKNVGSTELISVQQMYSTTKAEIDCMLPEPCECRFADFQSQKNKK